MELDEQAPVESEPKTTFEDSKEAIDSTAKDDEAVERSAVVIALDLAADTVDEDTKRTPAELDAEQSSITRHLTSARLKLQQQKRPWLSRKKRWILHFFNLIYRMIFWLLLFLYINLNI